MKFKFVWSGLMAGGAVVLGFSSAVVVASTTRVGNGDDGSDLEGFERVASGRLIEARDTAVQRLRQLNVNGIPGLGMLIPELEHSALYLAKRDVSANLDEDQGRYHTDLNGRVFARTFAEPHAPTRFFPSATTLTTDQLVALHVHEALHRALPSSIREDETKVSSLTLAMTGPEPTYDRVAASAKKTIPLKDREAAQKLARAAADQDDGDDEESDEDGSAGKNSGGRTSARSTTQAKYPIPEDARIRRPSAFAYTYESFSRDTDNQLTGGVQSMHIVESNLLAFGSDESPLGVGIKFTVINQFVNEQTSKNQLGPIGLSLQKRYWSSRGFDIGAYASASLNTMSSDEMKNTKFGRDIYTLGLTLRREVENFYLENMLSYSFAGDVEQKISNTDIKLKHKFGGVTGVSVRAGGGLHGFRLGGFGEILLSDYYRLEGPAFETYDSGRSQVVGVGPEISYENGPFGIRLFGKFIVSSTNYSNYDYIGNLLGEGSGQGCLGLNLSLNL